MKIRIYIFAFITFALLAVGLEWAYRYHYFFVEQNQLFLLSDHYFFETVAEPGGLAAWVAGFLVQFFALPLAGSSITALLLTAAGVLTALLCRRAAPGASLYLLWGLPVVSLLCIHFDFNFFYQGTIAFVIALVAMSIYVRIRPPGGRLVAGVVGVPLLFWLCGPVALLFALCVTAWEATGATRRWWLSPVVVIEAVVLAWAALHFSVIGEWRKAFSPEFYYTNALAPGAAIWFGWIALPTVIVAARLCRAVKPGNRKQELAFAAVQLTILAIVAAAGVNGYIDRKSYQMKKLDHFSRTEQWDKIIEQSQGPISNYLYLNLLNLALAQKGLLAEDIFKYDQRGPDGLFVPRNMTLLPAILHSDINFCAGNVAISQEMAFEAYVSTPGDGNPRMLKRLVQTNIICGEWAVAEKYLDILDKTIFYRRWAANHRRFLNDNAAVEADPVLGEKRKCLPSDNFIATSSDQLLTLEAVMRQYPESKTAIEYLGSLALLNKDLETFRALLEENYGTRSLRVLPRSFQEAVIILWEREPDVWQRYGVSDATMERFGEFRQKLLDNRSKKGVTDIIRSSHGDTFWFYYMFNEL
jgi:hypothetical protein